MPAVVPPKSREGGDSAADRPPPPVCGIIHVLSGRHRGLEIPLFEGARVRIGRRYDLEVVLLERDVSREHAVISVEEGRIRLEDRESTNGTLVNGELMEMAQLRSGDRVTIGKATLEVVFAEEAMRDVSVLDAKTVRLQADAVRGGEHSMVGRLDEIPLSDLMQLMTASHKSGVLQLETPRGKGRLHFESGRLFYATIGGSPDMDPTKALFRILRWVSGTFELRPPEKLEATQLLNGSTQWLLMEGMRQLDEFNGIMPRFPSLRSSVRVPEPELLELEELSSHDIEVVQAIGQGASIREVLNTCQLPDLDVLRGLEKLLLEGYLVVS